MTSISIWSFAALLLFPALSALVLPMLRGERAQRAGAALGAMAAFGVACLLESTLYAHPSAEALVSEAPLGSGSHALHFAIDGLSGPLLPLFTLLTLAFIWGSPRSMLSRVDLRSLLWLEALTLTTLCTDDLLVLGITWSALLVPLDTLTSSRRQGADGALVRRVFRLYHGVGLVCFVGACLTLAVWSRADSLLDVRVLHNDASGMPEQLKLVVFAAFALATLLRMGVAPFHSWLPLSIERGASSVPAALVALRTGLYVLVRVAIPAFPRAAHVALPTLTAIALCSALYGAFAALGQRDLRRMIGFFIVSQSGIMLTGVVFGDATAASGALLYWLGFATATTGLVLMVSALEARTGSANMRENGGIVGRVPNLAAGFFLFGLASIAIPGTVAFVAEDMLVHGALTQHPLLTVVMIAAMVLNAITFVRAFGSTFLGASRAPATLAATLEDLLPRERLTAVVLLLALIGAGLYPAPLIAAQSGAARAIAFRAQAAAK